MSQPGDGLTCVNPGRAMGVVTATVVTTPVPLYRNVTQWIWLMTVELDSVDGVAALPSRAEMVFPRRDTQPPTWKPGTRIIASDAEAVGYSLFKAQKVKKANV